MIIKRAGVLPARFIMYRRAANKKLSVKADRRLAASREVPSSLLDFILIQRCKE